MGMDLQVLKTQYPHYVFQGGLLALVWLHGLKLVSNWNHVLLKHILGFSFILKESSRYT